MRVSLHPPLEGSLQPGSTLAGTLDFSQAVPADGVEPGAGPTLRCMQVCRPAAGDHVACKAWLAGLLWVRPEGSMALSVEWPLLRPACPTSQVLILLETEEVVEQPWRRQVGAGRSAVKRLGVHCQVGVSSRRK